MKKWIITHKEGLLEAVFLALLFLFYLMWARIQSVYAGPDEPMRYDVVEYIIKHGSLPKGDDWGVFNGQWGISYAYYPILDYMFCAIFAKIFSLFGASEFGTLFGARVGNAILGVIMAFVVLRIAKRLFKNVKSWMFTLFFILLPGCVFLFTYVNNDALAMLSSAVILYSWVRYMDEGMWTNKNCGILAVGVALCALSYYNAYGFILVSILFFGVTLFSDAKKAGNMGIFVKKGILVCAVVLLLAGWWFVRNAILYDGDFLGQRTLREVAQERALEAYKPSNKENPQSMGWSLFKMLSEGYPEENTSSWVADVCDSFIGRFGQMTIFIPKWLSNNYQDFIKAGFLLVFLHPLKTFALRVKNRWSKKAFFHWCLVLTMVIPNILSVYYSYTSDYQPQGRYSLPMLIPLAYFVTMGYENFLEPMIGNAKIRKGIYLAFCIGIIAAALVVYFTVIWPAYRDVPFSIGAFLHTEG